MGACTFGQLQVGQYKNAGEAYSAACEEAQYEDGHNPYNGTISTTSYSSPQRGKIPRFGTKAFNEFIDKQLEDMSKRDCRHIELTGAALKKVRPSYLRGKRGVKAFYFFGWAAE